MPIREPSGRIKINVWLPPVRLVSRITRSQPAPSFSCNQLVQLRAIHIGMEIFNLRHVHAVSHRHASMSVQRS